MLAMVLLVVSTTVIFLLMLESTGMEDANATEKSIKAEANREMANMVLAVVTALAALIFVANL